MSAKIGAFGNKIEKEPQKLRPKLIKYVYYLFTENMWCIARFGIKRLKAAFEVGQNAVLTAFEWRNQESISLNPFAWHSNSYLTFNHSHGVQMTLELHVNGKIRIVPFERYCKNCYINCYIKSWRWEIKVRRRIFTFKTLIETWIHFTFFVNFISLDVV